MQEAGRGVGGNFDNIFDVTLMQAPGNRNKLNAEMDRHREKVEELGVDVNLLATKLRQREEELGLLRADTSSYIGNILVQDAGQGGSGKVNDIFDAMLMRAAGKRSKLEVERGRHREEVEELGWDIITLATKLRQREEELNLLRANASSYIGNITVQEAGQRGGGNVDNIFNATLMQAAGNRNKLNMERNRHREEEDGRNVNAPAMKLRQREEELESLRVDASSYIGNILVQEAGQGGGGNSMTSLMQR